MDVHVWGAPCGHPLSWQVRRALNESQDRRQFHKKGFECRCAGDIKRISLLFITILMNIISDVVTTSSSIIIFFKACLPSA